MSRIPPSQQIQQDIWEDISTIGNEYPGYLRVKCKRCSIQTVLPCSQHQWDAVQLARGNYLRACNRCGLQLRPSTPI